MTKGDINILEWMNECLTTPQHENRSAIGCQNKMVIKLKNIKKHSVKSYAVNKKYNRLIN